MELKTFVARSGWLSGEGRRLDATAYVGGGLQVRDRIVNSGQRYAELRSVTERIFYEARFARAYVVDS
jgi:hypothetical protein